MFCRNALKKSLVQALLFLLLTVGLRAGTAPPPQPLFTDKLAATGTSALVTPLEQTLLDHLNAAQSSIAITLYNFNRPGVRDALIAAQNRGITVRAVAKYLETHKRRTQYLKLRKEGYLLGSGGRRKRSQTIQSPLYRVGYALKQNRH